MGDRWNNTLSMSAMTTIDVLTSLLLQRPTSSTNFAVKCLFTTAALNSGSDARTCQWPGKQRKYMLQSSGWNIKLEAQKLFIFMNPQKSRSCPAEARKNNNRTKRKILFPFWLNRFSNAFIRFTNAMVFFRPLAVDIEPITPASSDIKLGDYTNTSSLTRGPGTAGSGLLQPL